MCRDWCIKELEEFASSAQRSLGLRIDEEKWRIFKVEKVPVDRTNWPALLQQGTKSYKFHGPDTRDMEVHEGDHLDLGDQHLIIHTAPGHTPGNLFIEGLLLKDGNRTYKGIWGGGGVGAPGLEGAKQGVINAQKLNAVQGVQVYLMTHSWEPPDGYPGGGIHERAKLLATRKPGDPHPFVDAASWAAQALSAAE